MKPYLFYRRNRGFTLIEVLISVTVMAFIAIAIYQNTAQSFSMREKLEIDADFYNGMRVVFDLINKDLNHIYTPQAAALPGQLGKAEPTPQGQRQDTQGFAESLGSEKYWAAPINTVGVRPSRFVGEATKLTFVTNNHVRLFRDSAESDFARISYTLEDSKLAEKDAKALVKREDGKVFAETDETSDAQKYILLTNVKSIKFQYLDGIKDTWYGRWDTGSSDHFNKFPAIVEMEIEVLMPQMASADPRDKRPTFTIKQRFRPELPL